MAETLKCYPVFVESVRFSVLQDQGSYFEWGEAELSIQETMTKMRKFSSIMKGWKSFSRGLEINDCQ